MTELQEAGGVSYMDVTFLNDATEALLEVRECARVLVCNIIRVRSLKIGAVS